VVANLDPGVEVHDHLERVVAGDDEQARRGARGRVIQNGCVLFHGAEVARSRPGKGDRKDGEHRAHG
jgi:hypothetical protein